MRIKMLETVGFEGRVYRVGEEYEVAERTAHALGNSAVILSKLETVETAPQQPQVLPEFKPEAPKKKMFKKSRKAMITGSEPAVTNK